MRKEETRLLLRWITFMAFLLILAVVSWNVISQSAALYRTTPEFRKMNLVELTLVNDDGESVQFEARAADEEDERSAGFAHVGAGVIRRTVILWMIDRETTVTFKTENVEAPIELAYLNDEGTVLEILEGKPHSQDPISFGLSVQFVLEAPAGFFETRHISKNGSVLSAETLKMLQELLAGGSF